MKIAVIGSRQFCEPDFVRAVLNDYFAIMTVFISGGASYKDKKTGRETSVDMIAENWVDEYNNGLENYDLLPPIKKSIFKADWDNLNFPDAIIKVNSKGKKYDALAGLRRNQNIIEEADLILVFWDGTSPGTRHGIDLAKKLKKPINIYIRT